MNKKDKKKPMEILRELAPSEIEYISKTGRVTQHQEERLDRIKKYNTLGFGKEIFVAGFEVDKFHPNGPEHHLITNSGIIYIYNSINLNLITVKGARGRQIRDFYPDGNIPSHMRELARMCYDRERTNPIHRM